ncbi:Crp/Fnr family transcriptional regulator [Flavobacterium chilense]|uniref:cAMP-binding domain of CRP or a regulatory subunit of cAMP-dependent protein kinases n=1 Tax=Flavobacterium chilense TaxID=946677 RepID=A0A1M7AGX8_9FLAO|nr:Crp/Fnr family transcriptional regulator [Flavobacterium chilense]SHL41806.1 cAMP-binding domain of CRP or a regulatory subunit of cAMP-dependent protein kinases [Flavobacterium chilense]
MNIQQLILHFENYLPLNDTEKEELNKRIIEKRVKRRQFILQESDVCRHYNFVASGLFKMYAVDKNGTEHNIQFASENEWITDIGSFHSDKPSHLYIEAIEPSVILQIEKKNLLFLYTHFPKFDRNFRVIIENKFIELENRVLQNISSTAEERYQTFLGQYPNLSNRLPNTQIASYLGITPEFLSKIRNNSIKK